MNSTWVPYCSALREGLLAAKNSCR